MGKFRISLFSTSIRAKPSQANFHVLYPLEFYNTADVLQLGKDDCLEGQSFQSCMVVFQ